MSGKMDLRHFPLAPDIIIVQFFKQIFILLLLEDVWCLGISSGHLKHLCRRTLSIYHLPLGSQIEKVKENPSEQKKKMLGAGGVHKSGARKRFFKEAVLLVSCLEAPCE
jgi:hypothetical protein